MANNGRIRGNVPNFSMIPNGLIEDKTVSFAAKGLYCLIARQLTKPNWTVYKKTLRTECKEGERAFERAWKELISTGYLKSYRLNGEGNRFYWEYELLEAPEPDPAEQEAEKEPENPHSPIPYKTYPMQTVGDANRGVYTVDKNTVNKNTVYNSLSGTVEKPQKTKTEEKREIIELYETIEEFVPEDVKQNSRHRKEICRLLLEVCPEERKRAIKQAYTSYNNSNSTIKKPLSYFIVVLSEELRNPTQEAPQSQNRQRTGTQIRFNDFEQRTYDYSELMKQLAQSENDRKSERKRNQG